MKIKRIKKLKVNNTTFDVVWDKSTGGASFDYGTHEISIGAKNEDAIFMQICHELMEIIAIEMCVSFRRMDCPSDIVFVYDHRQHTTMMYMFSGLLEQFIN